MKSFVSGQSGWRLQLFNKVYCFMSSCGSCAWERMCVLCTQISGLLAPSHCLSMLKGNRERQEGRGVERQRGTDRKGQIHGQRLVRREVGSGVWRERQIDRQTNRNRDRDKDWYRKRERRLGRSEWSKCKRVKGLWRMEWSFDFVCVVSDCKKTATP